MLQPPGLRCTFRTMRAATAVVACALWSCASPAATDSGVIAFSETGTGALVVAKVPSGERLAVLAPDGSPGALAIAPDRSQIAFAVEPELFTRRVFVGDIADGTTREVTPGTGEMMPEFRWGGDWFYYYVANGNDFATIVVPPGASAGRELGVSEVDGANEAVSPTQSTIAYTECSSGTGYTCPRELVVESVDGTGRTTIGMAAMIFVVAYTPDGRSVISYEQQTDADAFHLIRRDVELGTATDLGPAEPALTQSWQPGGASLLSPDGTEILTARDGALVAIRLDGSGSRVIADVAPTRAGFTGRGDVVGETERDLSTTDVGDLRYDLRVYSGGASVDLWIDQQQCNWPWSVSPDGEYVAWTCFATLSLFHLPDGALVRTGPPTISILGYDRDDLGVVTAEPTDSRRYDLYYTTHSGERTPLGHAWYQDTPMGNVEWPPFSFAP